MTGLAGARKAVYVTLNNPLLSKLFMNVLTEFTRSCQSLAGYRYYLSIYCIIPVSVTRVHRKLITDGHKHNGCIRRQSGGHGDH